MANRYTDEQRAVYYAAWLANGRNTKGTAIQQGIPETSMRAIVTACEGAVSETIREQYTNIWGRAQALAATRMMQLLPESDDLNAVTNAARVASGNYLDHRDGRKSTAPTLNLNQQFNIAYVEDWRG